eukprot:gene17033-biopygen9368
MAKAVKAAVAPLARTHCGTSLRCESNVVLSGHTQSQCDLMVAKPDVWPMALIQCDPSQGHSYRTKLKRRAKSARYQEAVGRLARESNSPYGASPCGSQSGPHALRRPIDWRTKTTSATVSERCVDIDLTCSAATSLYGKRTCISTITLYLLAAGVTRRPAPCGSHPGCSSGTCSIRVLLRESIEHEQRVVVELVVAGSIVSQFEQGPLPETCTRRWDRIPGRFQCGYGSKGQRARNPVVVHSLSQEKNSNPLEPPQKVGKKEEVRVGFQRNARAFSRETSQDKSAKCDCITSTAA